MRTFFAGLALIAASGCNGPPARLVVGDSDSVVVNSRRAMRLAVRVLDARGHALPDTGVRFEWLSGTLATVSPEGVVMCNRAGDAVVRASLGAVSTDVHLLCRPIQTLRAGSELRFVTGDSAQPIPLEALGLDGMPVSQLAGVATIQDDRVATLTGLRVTPRAPGKTYVTVHVGDRGVGTGVIVYDRVATLAAPRAGEPGVAAPVTLESGETRRWRLPAGRYIVGLFPDSSAVRFAVLDAPCVQLPWDRRIMCDADDGATVVAYAPWSAGSGPPVKGIITLETLAGADPRAARGTPTSTFGAPR
ncbi:MAG TPA: hypothetical protein VF761_13205 [Gemmatimonadaceae bacterium]